MILEEGDPLWLDNLLFSSSIKSFKLHFLEVSSTTVREEKTMLMSGVRRVAPRFSWLERQEYLLLPGRIPQAPSKAQGTFESMIFQDCQGRIWTRSPKKFILPTSSYNMGPFFCKWSYFRPPKMASEIFFMELSLGWNDSLQFLNGVTCLDVMSLPEV